MILCCGEVLIDLVPEPGSPVGAVLPLPGGGPFNTAIALARLGAKVGFCGPVSTDGFGADIAARLQSEGVLMQGPRSADPTPLAVVSLNKDGAADYRFYTRGTALHALSADDLPRLTAEFALFGGISLGLEPCGTGFEALFWQQKQAGALVLIDPNIRPAVIGEGGNCRARLARMLPEADILRLSDEDLAWLSPQPEVQLRDWLEAGVSLICLTLGAGGLRLLRQGLDLHLPARSVTTVDTIGAGDSFSAGLLYALSQMGLRDARDLRGVPEAALRRAADFAQRVAALTCTRQGADPPHRAELD